MRLFIKTLLIGLVLLSCLPAAKAQEEEVTFQAFYDGLGGYGSWIETDNYGYCWQPNIQDPDWRPYSAGYWVETDYGWTWVSDEPWGWATYHYGRWANLDGVGWVWVPGYRWAPAWVSWRYGDDYCGWAPLPPESFVDVEYASGGGLAIGVIFFIGDDCDRRYHIGAEYYNFIPIRYLGGRHYRRHYWTHRDNFQLINRTRNITNISFNKEGREDRRHVMARGPELKAVNALNKTPVPHRRLEISRQNTGRSAQLQADTLNIYAPRIKPETRREAGRPSRVARTLNQPRVNRGDDAAKPLQATRNAPIPGPEAIKEKHANSDNASVNAKVSVPPTTTTLTIPAQSQEEKKEEHRHRRSEDSTVERTKEPAPEARRSPASSTSEKSQSGEQSSHPERHSSSNHSSYSPPAQKVQRQKRSQAPAVQQPSQNVQQSAPNYSEGSGPDRSSGDERDGRREHH